MITLNGLLQILVYFAVLFACVKPLGNYMAKVYAGEYAWRIERVFYKLAGIKPACSMGGFLLLYARAGQGKCIGSRS